MVPIHESDVAENRWKDADWRQFELWERIEFRLKRKKNWTIVAVCLIFITLLSVPIYRDRLPKWTALAAMRALAVQVNQMKVDAATLGAPLRLRIEDSTSGPLYVIEKVTSCTSGVSATEEASAVELKRGEFFKSPTVGAEYRVLGGSNSAALGLERVTQSICYDPSPSEAVDTEMHALGILTVKDLAALRLDRIAFLNFSGLFTEIAFD